MIHPLGTIKDLATGTLSYGVSVPARLAVRAYGVTRGAVQVGRRVGRDATGRSSATTWETADQPAQREDDAPSPVNVVEELGLDPAPVARPTPLTSIDAQADPDQVVATPADVAERISRSEDR